MLKIVEIICYEIFCEIFCEVCVYQVDFYLVLVNQKVVDWLFDEELGNVVDFEVFIGCIIKFQVEVMYLQE